MLSALLLGTLMTSLSYLIVATAIPVVVATLGGFELYSWVFAGALLTSTVVNPIAGKMSDMYGRKVLYLTGMGIFMAGSMASGAAQTIEQLIIFRALQGIGAGCVQPTVAAMLADLFPIEQRARWQGINGAIWGLSSVLGPVLGGYLAEHVSWRWVFFVNVPPGLLAAALMARYLPSNLREIAHPEADRRPTIDYLGGALLSAALVALLLTTIWGGQLFPWASPQVGGLLVLSAALFAWFIREERRASEPIVPLYLFRNRTYQTAVALVFLSGIGMFGCLTYVPLYLQAVFGVSPTETGLLFLPTVVATSGMSVLAGMYMHRVGYSRMSLITMGIGAAGFALLVIVGPEAGVVPVVIGVSLIGSTIGLSFPVFIIVAQSAVEMRVVGVATSLVQITRSLGGSIGVTLLGAYATIRLADQLSGAGGRQDIESLLRPETVASMNQAQLLFLRQELTEAIRGMFGICTVIMIVAAALALRIGNVQVAASGRSLFGRR